MEHWLELVKQFGPVVAFMAFTVWRDFKREDRMSLALDKQQGESNTMLSRSITAIEQNTASNNNLTRAIQQLPCREKDGVDFRR